MRAGEGFGKLGAAHSIPARCHIPPVLRVDGCHGSVDNERIRSARHGVPAARFSLVEEDAVAARSRDTCVLRWHGWLRKDDELRVALRSGVPRTTNVKDTSHRHFELVAEQRCRRPGSGVVEGVDLAVVPASDVAAVEGDLILLKEVQVEVVGTPLGVLEGGHLPPILSSLNTNSVLGPAEGNSAGRAALLRVLVVECVGSKTALGLVNLGTTRPKPLDDATSGGVEGNHGGLLVAGVDNGRFFVGKGSQLLDQALHGEAGGSRTGIGPAGDPDVDAAVTTGLDGPDVVVDWAVVVVEDGAVGAVVESLNHGLVHLELPALLARLAVGGVEGPIDGRQKNKVFHFPVLQTPRILRRGEPGSGDASGPKMSWGMWCSDGLSRSQSREGARIVGVNDVSLVILGVWFLVVAVAVDIVVVAVATDWRPVLLAV